MRMSETLLDVKGMSCPLPVLRANRSLRSMAPGERLRVLATDRAAIADFKAFCQETGHALIAMSEEAGVLSFVIRRRPDVRGLDVGAGVECGAEVALFPVLCFFGAPDPLWLGIGGRIDDRIGS